MGQEEKGRDDKTGMWDKRIGEERIYVELVSG
jgi:hypothetical protein